MYTVDTGHSVGFPPADWRRGPWDRYRAPRFRLGVSRSHAESPGAPNHWDRAALTHKCELSGVAPSHAKVTTILARGTWFAC